MKQYAIKETDWTTETSGFITKPETWDVALEQFEKLCKEKKLKLAINEADFKKTEIDYHDIVYSLMEWYDDSDEGL